MKKYLALVWHIVSVLFFLVDPANAGPLVAAIGAIGTFIGSTALGGIVGKLLLYVGVTLASSLLQKALNKKKTPAQQVVGVEVDIKTGDDTAFSFPIGYTATAGKRKYAGSWGTVQKTPNAFFVDVVQFSDMPCAFSALWVDGRKCTVLFGEPHADGRGYPVQEFRQDGVDYMWAKFYDGSQTAADPYLLEKFAGGDRPWQNTMIGRRCAYAIITCRYKQELYANGVPAWLFETSGINLYDIRKDSTAGGSGSHRWGVYSTYEPSSNLAVMKYNVIRGIYDGAEWVYGGRNLAAHRLPASNWMAAANECDRVVSIIGFPDEQQYRGGLEISCQNPALAVLEELRKGCNGSLAEAGGIFKTLVGAPGSFVYAFTDEGVIITEGQSYEPFPGLDQTFNGAEATFPNPAEKWSTKDAPALYMPDLELLDGTRRLASGLSFPCVPYPFQVQRLQRSMVSDNRRFRVHQFYLRPEAFPLEPNDVVSWTSTINGYMNKLFIVKTLTRTNTTLVMVQLREIDPSDYDWSTDFQLPTSTGWVGEINAPPQLVFGFQAFPVPIKDGSGANRRPGIGITVAQDLEDVSNVWVQVRVKATQAVRWDSSEIKYGSPYAWTLGGDFLPNTEYEVRIKYIALSARRTEWSEWETVLTDNILLTDKDVYLPGLTDEIKNMLVQNMKFVSDGLRFHQETLERIDSLVSENGSQSYLDIVSFSAKLGDSRADYNRKIAVVVTENTALAARIETVNTSLGSSIASVSDTVSALSTTVDATAAAVTAVSASFGKVKADGLFRVQATAAIGGALTTVALSAAASDGAGTTGSAALFLTAKSDGTSDVIVNSTRFIISNMTNSEYPFIFSGGVLTMNATRVNLIEAGLIRSLNQRVNFDLNNARLTMSDNT